MNIDPRHQIRKLEIVIEKKTVGIIEICALSRGSYYTQEITKGRKGRK